VTQAEAGPEHMSMGGRFMDGPGSPRSQLLDGLGGGSRAGWSWGARGMADRRGATYLGG